VVLRNALVIPIDYSMLAAIVRPVAPVSYLLRLPFAMNDPIVRTHSIVFIYR